MSKIRRHQTPSSAQLLNHVLARPELVAAVRELPGAVLATLIERVGLEDAGEIVALASAEQLVQAFEQDLWRAERAGGDELFQLERFGLWLEVLAEAGDDFLAQRLSELPRDLLLLVLHQAVLVLDLDALAVKMAELGGEDAEWTEKALESGHYEEWEEFRLIVRAPEHWDVLWSALSALDRDHHELLRDLFERCAALDTEFINGNGGLYEVLTSEELLENDLAAERADHRAAQGHVSPPDARAFLSLAQRGDVVETRDAITHAYFRELAPAKAQSVAPRAVERLTRLVAEVQPASQARARATRALAPGKREKSNGKALAKVADTQHERSLFERALAELQDEDRVTASQRLEELAYLANVWIAGGVHEGRRPRPIEALEFALVVCNRGLARAVAEAGKVEAAQLLAQTSADLLFRRGYTP